MISHEEIEALEGLLAAVGTVDWVEIDDRVVSSDPSETFMLVQIGGDKKRERLELIVKALKALPELIAISKLPTYAEAEADPVTPLVTEDRVQQMIDHAMKGHELRMHKF